MGNYVYAYSRVSEKLLAIVVAYLEFIPIFPRRAEVFGGQRSGLDLAVASRLRVWGRLCSLRLSERQFENLIRQGQ